MMPDLMPVCGAAGRWIVGLAGSARRSDRAGGGSRFARTLSHTDGFTDLGQSDKGRFLSGSARCRFSNYMKERGAYYGC